MKWKIKDTPHDNEVREIMFFAWLPINCGRHFRWLEVVKVRQFYKFGEWNNSDFLN